MSVKEAIEKEQIYFKSHPVYSSMPEELFGTVKLTERLTKTMFTHIKHNLPDIIKEVKDRINDIADKLKDLGTPPP